MQTFTASFGIESNPCCSTSMLGGGGGDSAEDKTLQLSPAILPPLTQAPWGPGFPMTGALLNNSNASHNLFEAALNDYD